MVAVSVSAFLRCVHLVPGSTSFLGLVQIEAEKGLLHIVGCRICFFFKKKYLIKNKLQRVRM